MRGVTLVEMMVGILITSILLFAGVIYMTGYLPRQRLNDQAFKLRNFLVSMQERAKNRQESYCLVIDRSSSPVRFSFYQDLNGNLLCPEAGEPLVDQLALDESISIPSCSGSSTASTWLNSPYTLFFMANGRMDFRNNGAYSNAATVLELILSSNKLASGSKSREVELEIALGRIDVTPVGKTGIGRVTAGVGPAPTGTVLQKLKQPLYCE